MCIRDSNFEFQIASVSVSAEVFPNTDIRWMIVLTCLLALEFNLKYAIALKLLLVLAKIKRLCKTILALADPITILTFLRSPVYNMIGVYVTARMTRNAEANLLRDKVLALTSLELLVYILNLRIDAM